MQTNTNMSSSQWSNESIHRNELDTTYDTLLNINEDNIRKNDNLPIPESRDSTGTMIVAKRYDIMFA